MVAFRGIYKLFQLRFGVKLSFVNQRSHKIWWLRFFSVPLHRISKNFSSVSAGSHPAKRFFWDHFWTFFTMKNIFDIQLITAAILSIGGLILLFLGVYIEPQGQIHESLLVAFGETATFAGALFGIDYVYKKRK